MANGLAGLTLSGALYLAAGPAPAATVSDPLISEITSNPAGLSDREREWFEPNNPTPDAINLEGVTIGDDCSDRHRIETDQLILPGEYLTLARGTAPGLAPDYIYSGFTLGNSADEIPFGNALGELLRLDYGDDFAVTGISREMSNQPVIEANYGLTPAAFGYATGDFAITGRTGSFAPAPMPLQETAWVLLSGLAALLSPLCLPRLDFEGQRI